MEFNFANYPNRINLGCGFDKREGYLNIDLGKAHDPDVVGNVLDLNFLPKAYYVDIVAQDILEHLPRYSTKRALFHWASLLKLGGLLHLRVPSILGVCRLLNDPVNQNIKRHEELIRGLFGTQAYSGDFHFTTFTDLILYNYLNECGYSVLKITELDGWLFDVVAEKTASVNPRDIDDFSDLLELSLQNEEFVEKCYFEILGRKADAGGLKYYTEEINEGKILREQLISILTSSPERNKKNPFCKD